MNKKAGIAVYLILFFVSILIVLLALKYFSGEIGKKVQGTYLSECDSSCKRLNFKASEDLSDTPCANIGGTVVPGKFDEYSNGCCCRE